MTDPSNLSADQRDLRDFALSLPGAHEDFPWGDRVAKVGKKVFAFLGNDDKSAGVSLAVLSYRTAVWMLWPYRSLSQRDMASAVMAGFPLASPPMSRHW